MSDIPHLDARVDAMQKELLGQLSMQSARLAAMASELAACREELKEAQKESAKEAEVPTGS